MMRSVLLAATSCLVTVSAAAQLPQTRFGSVFPPGGQAGTTFDVRVFGEQDLDYADAPRLIFSHSGLRAEPLLDPTTGAWQNNAFRVTATNDVPAGRYDVRLAGYYGVSPPRSFLIDAVPAKIEQADPTESAPATLPANEAFYGRIAAAADVDVFTFAGAAGGTVVFRCDTGSLDSPLQPLVELIDPAGRRLGHAGGSYSNEAMLPLVLPATGEYRIRVSDAAYRGGGDFAYRIEAATRPVVASIWPPFGKPGAVQQFELRGYNIPDGEPLASGLPLVRRKVQVAMPQNHRTLPTMVLMRSSQIDVDGFDYVFRDGDAAADSFPIFFSPADPSFEQDNDSPVGQPASIPSEIAGQFEKRNDSDRYVFAAKAGEIVLIDVFAKRYGSAADPMLTIDQISGPDGQPKERRLAAADDRIENVAAGVFDTMSDDPTLRFDVPEDGRYRMTIRDRYFSSRGSEELFYRLSLRRPQPEFRLVVVPHNRDDAAKSTSPAAVNLRKGENVAVPIYLIRRDGFSGPVRVSAQNLPSGLTAREATVAGGQSSTTLLLSASDDAATWLGPVTIVADAIPAIAIEERPEQTAQQVARAGTVVRGGANQSTVSRLTDDLVVAILDEALPFRIDGGGDVIQVGQGSQALIPLSIERKNGFTESVTITTSGLAGDAKIAADVKPFTPEINKQFARLLVDAQAPARSYTLDFQGTAKIDVARFPHRLARAKATADRAAQAFAQADTAVRSVTASREEAMKALQAAEAMLQAAPESEKPQAAVAVEAARTTDAERESAVKSAEVVRKQAEAAKAAAEKLLADATQAATPQKADYISPAASVTLSVVPSPVALTAVAADNGQVKRGEAVELKITVNRKDGFAGPIHVSLVLPEQVSGLSAEPVAIDAEAVEGTLRVVAASDVSEGDVLFPAVRAVVEHNGAVQINIPISLKIIP